MNEEAEFDKTYPESVMYTFSLSFSFELKPGGRHNCLFPLKSFLTLLFATRFAIGNIATLGGHGPGPPG